MKVTSVNIDRKSKLPLEQRLFHNKLEVLIHRKCISLSAPDDEMYSAFAELSKIPITKTPQQSVHMEPGGIVGDKHFEKDVVQKKEDDTFYKVSVNTQISLMSKERYNQLNQLYDKNIQAGQFGENIQIEGIDSIESLSQGTVLQLGESAQIKIVNLRTFCYKFANVMFPTVESYFDWKKSGSGGVINQIGVLAQVINPGTVYPGDTIKIVHEPDKYTRLGYIQRPNGVASHTPCDPPTTT